MPITTRLTERAITLSKAGKKREARLVLDEVLRREPRNEIAWLWHVDTFTTPAERIAALRRMLQVIPNHPLATRALAQLEKDQPAPAAGTPPKKDSIAAVSVIASNGAPY